MPEDKKTNEVEITFLHLIETLSITILLYSALNSFVFTFNQVICVLSILLISMFRRDSLNLKK